MKHEIRPLWVLVKALFLFIAINIVFAVANPRVGKITLYNSILPGRLRFPYEQEPAFYSLGHNAPVYEDFDAMFGAHIISRKKQSNEFRIVLLGDSSTWGISVGARDTLAEQINRLNVQSCDGRNVRAYNLGYPMPFLMRDLLILDTAMEYQPDMVLWLVTLYTLEPKAAERYFIAPHEEHYRQLATTYNLKFPHLSQSVAETSLMDKTIFGQRKRLKNIMLTQAFGVAWAATGIDNHEVLQPEVPIPSADVDNDISYDGQLPGGATNLFDSLMLDVLSAGFKIAGDVPVVLVNEPMFIAQGKNHLIKYNSFYPRWIYDEYRVLISDWTGKQDYPLLDAWDALPPEDFADQNFHRNSKGEEQFAAWLAPEIKRLACP